MTINNNVPLYKYDSKGKVRVWQAYLRDNADNKTIEIVIVHGLLDGKKQEKLRIVKSGKNKGKSNETTLQQQAELELGYLYTKQLDDSYVYNIEDYVEPMRPQLAFKYKEKKHLLQWKPKEYVPSEGEQADYLLSRKLNGIRCFIFADYTSKQRTVRFESRTGKPFKFLTHLDLELALKYSSVRNVIFDGELFHPEIPFEIICTLVNSDDYVTVTDPATGKVWSTNDIQFHCYDIVDVSNKSLSYTDRFIKSNWYSTPSSSIVYVENVPVFTEEDMVDTTLKWIAQGYEGGMLRVAKAAYEFGKRTPYLLKYKVMEQEEFLITKLYLAENDPSKVMAQVSNHHNDLEGYDVFDCSLKGNKEENMKYFLDKQNYENKAWLTIDYQVLSAYNVPLFPVGITIRKGSVVDGVFIPEV